MARSDVPNHTIHTMYLEIINISQGLNVALLVSAVVQQEYLDSIIKTQGSTLLFAAASLAITIIFWARFYLDTDILKRSYSLSSTTLFFLFAVSAGINIQFLARPVEWLLTSGILLFIGFCFYTYNLEEIARKQAAGFLTALSPRFIQWQRRRKYESLLLALLAFGGTALVYALPDAMIVMGIVSLVVAVWQLIVTSDYRKYQFLDTGL